MISKKAVNDFLKRPLDNWYWMKDLKRRQVFDEIVKLAPDFKFKTSPYKHQMACFLIGMYNPYFNWHLDMGFGKTKLSLDLIKLRKKRNEKYLILVPSTVSVTGWINEINIHSDFDAIKVVGSVADREYALSQDVDLYVMNYDGLQWLLCEQGTNKKDKGAMLPIEQKIKDFSKLFSGIVMDETHLKGIKNQQSLTWKLCKAISKNSRFRYGLTGTPMGKDPQDLWPQFYLMDRGETLGETIGLYRQAFFTSSFGYFGGIEHKFNSKKEKLLHEMIAHRSIRYSEDELSDVPPVVRKNIEVEFTQEIQAYYNRALNGLREELKGGFKTLENGFMKLRQLSSGFLYFKNEKERISLDFDPNPKIDALEELLLSIKDEDKVIIFCDFIETGNKIEELLNKLKIMYVRLYGGTKDSDRENAQKLFTNSRHHRVFLANSQSGGTSLNLQVAKYGIFFESPIDPITRKQAEKRFTGARQQHKIAFIYDIIMKDSKDEAILQSIAEGKSIFDAIIEGKIKL